VAAVMAGALSVTWRPSAADVGNQYRVLPTPAVIGDLTAIVL